MEHFGKEFNNWRFVWIFFTEFQSQFESAILKWGFMRSKDYCIPKHDVVLCRSSTDSCWWILLESFEVSHQTSSSCCSHGQKQNLTLIMLWRYFQLRNVLLFTLLYDAAGLILSDLFSCRSESSNI